jgi:DNA-binding NtrC family response regulator
LRQRPEDIPFLVRQFLDEAGSGNVHVSYETIERLQHHDWPGNVRELKNYVERAVVLSEHGRLDTKHLSTPGQPVEAPVGGDEAPSSLKVDYRLPFKDAKARLLDTFERRYWSRMLDSTGQNVSEAARRAGIHRKSLEYLLRKLDLRGSSMDKELPKDEKS